MARIVSMRIFLLIFVIVINIFAQEKMRIKALAIPLADHYPAIVAYEKYKNQMQYAEYDLLILNGPNLVRSYFYSYDDADVALNVSPMVMDMFAHKPNFRWISLIHRDGNALAINDTMNQEVKLHPEKSKRLPDEKIAQAFSDLKMKNSEIVHIAIPSLLATHTTILYKYLKEHNKTMSLYKYDNPDVLLKIVKPPKSPMFLQSQTTLSHPAALEQSMPWPEIANANSHGHIAWYSKDVMQTKHGHVECIVIAKDEAIQNKRKALEEFVYFLHKAGRDIEAARAQGGEALEEIVQIIRKHIPAHSRASIQETLRIDINAINYKNLNIDAEVKRNFAEIMDLAYEAKFIKTKIDIDALVDDSFQTEFINEQ